MYSGTPPVATIEMVNFRGSNRRLAVWALLAGLLLRALTPAGYMPAASNSGSLFALCPEQLPPGFVLPGATNGHEHHHGSAEDGASSETDSCQVGHMLSSAAAIGEPDPGEPFSFGAPVVSVQPAVPLRSAASFVLRSRGPPA